MLTYGIRCFTVRDLPSQLSCLQIQSGNPAPRWLDERQSLDLQVVFTFGFRGRVRVSWEHRAVVVHLRLFRVVDQSDWKHAGARRHIQDLRVWIERASAPVHPTGYIQHEQSAWPFPLADHRWRENRPNPVIRYQLDRLGAKLRGEIDQVIDDKALPIKWRWLGRKRLGWGIPFARYSLPRDRPLLDRPDGLSVRTNPART